MQYRRDRVSVVCRATELFDFTRFYAIPEFNLRKRVAREAALPIARLFNAVNARYFELTYECYARNIR